MRRKRPFAGASRTGYDLAGPINGVEGCIESACIIGIDLMSKCDESFDMPSHANDRGKAAVRTMLLRTNLISYEGI